LNAEEIMILILYSKFLDYKNTKLSEVRWFLEPKLQGERHSERNIVAMQKEALDWLRTEVSEAKLKEAAEDYYTLQLVEA